MGLDPLAGPRQLLDLFVLLLLLPLHNLVDLVPFLALDQALVVLSLNFLQLVESVFVLVRELLVLGHCAEHLRIVSVHVVDVVLERLDEAFSVFLFERGIGFFELIHLLLLGVLVLGELGHFGLVGAHHLLFLGVATLKSLFLKLFVLDLNVVDLVLQVLDLFITLSLALCAVLNVGLIVSLLALVLLLEFGDFVLQNFLVLLDQVDLLLRGAELVLHQLFEFADGLGVSSHLSRVDLPSLELLEHLIVSHEDSEDFGSRLLNLDDCVPLLLGGVLIINLEHLDAILETVGAEVFLESSMAPHELADLRAKVSHDLLLVFVSAHLGEELLVEESQDLEFPRGVLYDFLDALSLHIYRLVVIHPIF